MTDHDCPTCGKTLETEHGLKVHHARTHGESLVDYHVYDCEVCGTTRKFRESEVTGHNPQYCSMECRIEDSGVELVCEHCGETFSVNPSKADDRRFCDRDCYRAAVVDAPIPE